MQRGAKSNSSPGVPLAPTAITSPEGSAEPPLHRPDGAFHVATRPADELPALVPKRVLPQPRQAGVALPRGDRGLCTSYMVMRDEQHSARSTSALLSGSTTMLRTLFLDGRP